MNASECMTTFARNAGIIHGNDNNETNENHIDNEC